MSPPKPAPKLTARGPGDDLVPAALLAFSGRAVAENIARARELLAPPIIPVDAIKAISPNAAETQTTTLCPCGVGRMVIIERFQRGMTIRGKVLANFAARRPREAFALRRRARQ